MVFSDNLTECIFYDNDATNESMVNHRGVAQKTSNLSLTENRRRSESIYRYSVGFYCPGTKCHQFQIIVFKS